MGWDQKSTKSLETTVRESGLRHELYGQEVSQVGLSGTNDKTAFEGQDVYKGSSLVKGREER